MNFTNVRVSNFENALRGMRNPKESYHLIDSYFGIECDWENAMARTDGQLLVEIYRDNDCFEFASIGPNDMRLARNLIRAGSEHRKFLRQIQVSIDITAPLFWWKEFDTYKVGTTANSTSTMHKITSKPITIDCFEIDDFNEINFDHASEIDMIIHYLEKLRLVYLDTKDPKYWKELIRWLPESWLQTRTITMNYENLYTIVRQRSHHKLTEWHSFIKFIRTLPYASEFIFDEDSVEE